MARGQRGQTHSCWRLPEQLRPLASPGSGHPRTGPQIWGWEQVGCSLEDEPALLVLGFQNGREVAFSYGWHDSAADRRDIARNGCPRRTGRSDSRDKGASCGRPRPGRGRRRSIAHRHRHPVFPPVCPPSCPPERIHLLWVLYTMFTSRANLPTQRHRLRWATAAPRSHQGWRWVAVGLLIFIGVGLLITAFWGCPSSCCHDEDGHHDGDIPHLAAHEHPTEAHSCTALACSQGMTFLTASPVWPIATCRPDRLANRPGRPLVSIPSDPPRRPPRTDGA